MISKIGAYQSSLRNNNPKTLPTRGQSKNLKFKASLSVTSGKLPSFSWELKRITNSIKTKENSYVSQNWDKVINSYDEMLKKLTSYNVIDLLQKLPKGIVNFESKNMPGYDNILEGFRFSCDERSPDKTKNAFEKFNKILNNNELSPLGKILTQIDYINTGKLEKDIESAISNTGKS